MGHCIVSLKVAKRFEMGDKVQIEPICIKGEKSYIEDQASSNTSKGRGYFALNRLNYLQLMIITLKSIHLLTILFSMR